MKVADLMTRDARACTIHDSLNAAARIMWDHDCGCAPVVDGHGRLAGIVTDRDICMAAYTQGLPLEAIPVERAMSPRVISCARGDDLEAALGLMRTHEIHRIPVADSRGRLVGILSLSDLVNYSGGDSAAPSEAAEIAATISAIRRRRKPAAAASASPNGDAAPARESTKAPKKAPARRRKPSADLR
ncbi:CBS domain-containing protein [Candidatus Binatus soli]|uniref:CBS domain-containing protein n=1 Tax=Candidatus Binatus soli TaxID=1953413 RepID=UPI003D0E5B42